MLHIIQEACTFPETRAAIAAAGPGDHIVAWGAILLGLYLWGKADDENWHRPIIAGVLLIILLNLAGMNPGDILAQTINGMLR